MLSSLCGVSGLTADSTGIVEWIVMANLLRTACLPACLSARNDTPGQRIDSRTAPERPFKADTYSLLHDA